MAVAAVVVLATAATAMSGDSGAPRWLVFAATPTGSKTDQLFRIQSSGDGQQQLTTGAYPSIAPAFSPDGKRLAFARSGIGLELMNVDGTGLHRLTTNGRDSFPAWSPDGRRVAFTRPTKNGWRIWVVSTSGGAPRLLRHAPPSGRPSWTKAGLLIPSGGDLLKVDPQTGKVLKYYGANIDAVWGLDTTSLAPDVSTLAYVGARDPDPGDKECGEGPCQRFALYVEGLLSKKKRPQLLYKDVGPAAFSPDGKSLAFVAQGQLEIAPRSGGAPLTLGTSDAYPTIAAPPAWQPR